MSRAPGSGLYRDVAAAAEELWAAVLAGSRPRQADWSAEIDHLFATGQSGLAGSVLLNWFRQVASGLALPVRTASRETPDMLGDVSAHLSDGTKVWFELKTQTQKARFADLTQADWVRDATTATAWFCLHDRAIAGALSRSALGELSAPPVPPSWGLEDVWLGDLLLLTDGAKRAAAAATDRAGMASFAERKYVVHTTQEGARAIRMADLAPVAGILRGQLAQYDVHFGSGAAVGVWLTAGRYPTRSDIHFSYNMGYSSGVLGRHKLHATPLDRDPWVVSGSPAPLPGGSARGVVASVAVAPPKVAGESEIRTGAPINEEWLSEDAIDLASVSPGMRVRHRSKGVGQIISVRVLAGGAELTIAFDPGGETTIAMGYKTLEFRVME